MDPTPDLVVGVDFGMTYTGVAWSNLLTAETFVIKDWPGLGQDAHETKVPSKLMYARDRAVRKWGFLCDTQDEFEEPEQLHEWFKIYLDQANVDRAKKHDLTDTPQSVEEAKKLTTDYLRQVYNQTKRVIEGMSGGWSNKRVEFVFSMPTTWTSQAILNEFKEVIQESGFGCENLHTANLELTEAEAVAVYTVKTAQIRFQQGDIFLVCDAGGGTTDLGLVEVVQTDPGVPVLRQVAEVSGVGIGSTVIDRAFQALVQSRIDQHPGVNLPDNLAFTLSRTQAFRSIKHNFGSVAGDQQTFYLPIDIDRDFSHAGLGIGRGRMAFPRSEIQSLFDPQIEKIISKINHQFSWMQENRPTKVVNYLVLSGGLGGSEYVRSVVEQRYSTHPHPGAPNLHVFKSQEPRLAVAKGLVMDRRQRLVHGASALKTRVARASYGILCRLPFNENIHSLEDMEHDKFEKGKRWAVAQIDWFIRKGDIIDTDAAVERQFERKLKPGHGHADKIWDSHIVISHAERTALPRGLRQDGANKLCIVKSDLTAVQEREFEEKNKKCWQGRRYFLAKFTIKVLVAPADLKFELWFKGKKYSRGHDSVTIQWDPAGALQKPFEQDPDLFELETVEPPKYRPASRMNVWGSTQ